MRRLARCIGALAAGLWAGAALACGYPPGPPGAEVAVSPGDPARAFFVAATARYPHGVLGDAVEAGGLVVQRRADLDVGRCGAALMLPEHAVFEDVGPRLADLDGDGTNEVVVVETDTGRGAQLAVYGLRDGALVKLAATEPIGQARRWLAPAGIADFDGDGRREIAYVETPHLGRVLRIVALRGGRLVEVAAAKGLTNHRIGDRTISGGVRDCGRGTELITANAGWTRLLASRLQDGRIVARDLGPLAGAEDFTAALACRR